ncbi:MAG: phenylalanine--tRNA ligase subunit beta [Halobacteriaceae archaeon]
MPVVEVDPDELRQLTNHHDKSDEAFKDDLFELGLEFEGRTESGAFELELEPDRLDRLSPTGVARSLRYQYGDDRGVYVPDPQRPEWTIEVEPSVPDARPYVTGAVVRGLTLDERGLEALLQLQEKLHATMGRNRAKGAIGVHDLTMLKGEPLAGQDPEGATPSDKQIRYAGVEADGDRFVPLDSDAEMTPGDVLSTHPIGQEYAALVAEYDRYPAIYDDVGLFSFPPVINGRRTEVTTDTRDVLIELTGTDQWTIDRMGTILCYALDARGGQVESVSVRYPDRELTRPDLQTRSKRLAHERLETMLGISLDPDTVRDLAERSGLDAEVRGGDDDMPLAYDVTIPPYRTDVRHPVDLVDDLGRAYGFNNLEPRYPEVGTVGQRTAASRLSEAVRTRLVGLGFEDLLNFNLTSQEALFEAMSLAPSDEAFGAAEPATITEPYSAAYEVVRTWVLPSLLQVCANNSHRAYPQNLAEIGLTAHVDTDEPTRVGEAKTVAAVLAGHDASYETAKARLAALVEGFDSSLSTPATAHPSFIDGRTAAVAIDGDRVGIIGELHPEVIVEHDLEVPVAGFEFSLAALDH